MFKVEVSGVDPLISATVRWADFVPKKVEQAVEVTLRHIKDDAREAAKSVAPKKAPDLPQSIGYTMDEAFAGGAAGEVGYRRGMKYAGLPLEIGTRHTAPKPILREAAEKNRQDFFDGVGKAVKDGLR